ncbi:hypothetical protein NMY22_g1179 [Coprinellus aureogranulatus]|nr:hypothetical protein NMY22_g1179 [Coprinellus aureogranulatus]
MPSSTRACSAAAKVKEDAKLKKSGEEVAIRSATSSQSAAELKKARKESDQRARRVRWEFEHMGNKFYKDPDAQLESAEVSDTSSPSSPV